MSQDQVYIFEGVGAEQGGVCVKEPEGRPHDHAHEGLCCSKPEVSWSVIVLILKRSNIN